MKDVGVLTWIAVGFMCIVAAVAVAWGDYQGASTAVFLAFVLLVIALKEGSGD